MRQLNMFPFDSEIAQMGVKPIPSNHLEKSYFNTTKIRGEELLEAESDAKAQEQGIMIIFKENSPLTPWQTYNIYVKRFGPAMITSIRRGITNLTKQKLLTKTSLQVRGPYKNRPEFVWKTT